MKYCKECECRLPNDYEGDICEVCREERGDTISDIERMENDEESLYPSIVIGIDYKPSGDAFDKLLDRRIAKMRGITEC